MKKVYTIILSLVLLTIFSSNGWGAVLYVPSQYSTIQAAINAANSGDEIHVASGTYVENNFGWTGLSVQNKSLKIVGAGSGSTKIQVQNLTNGLEVLNSTSSPISFWLQGFTLEPYGATGPGFFIRFGETGGSFDGITMKDVIVSKAEARNVLFESGGTYSNISVDNCKFVDSKYWGFSINWPSVTVQNVTITNSYFLRNGSNGDMNGYGLELINVNNLTISGCTFNRNRAGGLSIKRITNANISNSSWWRNGESATTAGTPNSTLEIYHRYGIKLWEDFWVSSNINITGCTISETFGRAINLGTYKSSNSIDGVTVTNCVFHLNDIDDGSGTDYQNLIIWETPSSQNGTPLNGGPVSNVNFNKNSFITGSVSSNSINPANLSCNWWGTTDPCVIKNRVSGLVNIAPYLTNGTDNEPGTPGFQPVPGSCNGNTNLVQNINTGKWFCAIQPAINDASTLNGHTIEVYDGTYNENVTINKSLTVRAINPPTNTALITGTVDITANNVTLENFKIDPPAFTASDAAIYINASNVIVKNNIITGVSGSVASATLKGIHIYEDGPSTISNIKIEKNVIENISNTALGGAVGIAVQGFVDQVYILDNEFNNIVSGAWGYGIDISPTDISDNNTPTNVNVLGNLFVDINKTYNPSQPGTPYPGVAVLIGKTNTYNKIADPSTYKINFNNFTGPTSVPAGVANSHISNYVNAEYNWWGHCNGPTVYPYTTPYGSASSGFVDYDPWLGNYLGDPALWLSSINAKRHGDERLSKWLSMDCGNREAVQNAPNRQPIYADGWVKFESDYGVNKYGFSDVMEVARYGNITATDVENTIDKWHPSKEKKNLFVTFKTGSSVDAEAQPPVYYRDGRQCIFEAGGPLSGYNLYIVSGKLVFGMWNRFESKYTILENSSLYPLSTNKTYYGYLKYDGTKFQAVLSDGSTITPSPEISFAGISQDAEDKTGIGGAARTRYHDYSVGSTYSDEFDGLLGDIIIYSGEFTEAADVNSYLFARYGVPSGTSPRISTQDWIVISDIDKTGDNAISSAYPNPFSHKTSIGVNLTSEQFVNVELLDLMGRKVLNVFKGKLGEGIHDIEIDGTGLSSGIYFIKVAGEMFTQTTQVILNR
ncbi:MAG: T9SS type A sorting domain-containing protein [Candidatus Kapabacteria bacterium]|nr:T9SS type A sorting domain-containing protein [Candidatus Kapabacteria bacterium]